MTVAKAAALVQTRADKIFTSNVRRYRVLAGMMQYELATRLNTYREYVSDIEHGKYSSTIKQVQKIAEAFGVPPWAMLDPTYKYTPQKELPSYDATEAFSKNIRNLRWTLGLSQKELASRMNTHRAYIADLERGRNSNTLRVLQRLADAFHINPHILLRPFHPTG